MGVPMEAVTLFAGAANVLPDSLPVTQDHFGYNYTGFRPFGRFQRQLGDDPVGLITWPGGSVAENLGDGFGLAYDDLWNDRFGFGLNDVFAAARARDAAVAIVLPTLPYQGGIPDLQADIDSFIARLGGGDFGPLPRRLILEVGSEYYATFGPGVESATIYGRIADDTVQALSRALADPALNPDGIAPEIAVQSGISAAEDAAIRDEMDDASLARVDMLIHHRFPLLTGGVDNSAETLTQAVDDWAADMATVGAERPGVFLSSYNVASLTREEARAGYVAERAAVGEIVDPAGIDLAARNDAAFERYWQDQMHLRDYGQDQPRVLLELHARTGAVGMEAASAYGVDMIHAGRLTTTDLTGQSQDFIGQEMLDMMAESLIDTRPLRLSLRNRAVEDVATYAWENDDKLVAFITLRDQDPGTLEVRVPGLAKGAYHSVWAETLTDDIPQDWMTRFGIADRPDVDESPESHSYALGLRETVDVSRSGGFLSVDTTHEDQVIRLVFAKTESGARDIAEWADGTPLSLLRDSAEPVTPELTPDLPPIPSAPPPTAAPRPDTGFVVPQDTSPEDAETDPEPQDAADSDFSSILGGAVFALGVLLMAI
ncbi:MAG: hypothetical protein CFE34_12755 [Rhodobacteraceae bacterium PARR1]|nr:MAG: hypothetical protein CFE34_12755 [Rhodobacteraceae bacterium PARR1]